MLSHELGELLRPVAGQLGQPGAHRGVGAAPSRDRQAGVGHVADERVLDQVLGINAEGGGWPQQDQASPLKAVKLRLEILRAYGVAEGFLPEDATNDGCLSEDAPLALRKRVDARCQQRVDRVRQGDRLAIALRMPSALPES